MVRSAAVDKASRSKPSSNFGFAKPMVLVRVWIGTEEGLYVEIPAESAEEPIMRLTMFVLPLFLLLCAVSWAQTSSPAAPTGPGPGQGGPMMEAPQPPGMAMGHPPMSWPYPYQPWTRPQEFRHHRGPRILAAVLGTLLALSGTFALTALGIFLIRRSRPSP